MSVIVARNHRLRLRVRFAPASAKRQARFGLTLLEVLIALAILLSAVVVIGRLITLSGDHALDVQQQGRAAQLAQAKLAEVVAGVEPMNSQSDLSFEEDPDWHWSLDAEQDTAPGLWRVKVTVSRPRSDGSQIECALHQLVLDPSLRGSTLDATAAPTVSNTSAAGSGSGSGASSGGGKGKGGASGGGAGGGAKGGMKGGARPPSTGGSTPAPAPTGGGAKGGAPPGTKGGP